MTKLPARPRRYWAGYVYYLMRLFYRPVDIWTIVVPTTGPQGAWISPARGWTGKPSTAPHPDLPTPTGLCPHAHRPQAQRSPSLFRTLSDTKQNGFGKVGGGGRRLGLSCLFLCDGIYIFNLTVEHDLYITARSLHVSQSHK